MAKKKKYHQPQPLIKQINARRVVEKRLADEAIQEKIESEATIMAFLCLKAVHKAFHAGELRILRDYIPALDEACAEYQSDKAIDVFYANEKLKRELTSFLPNQRIVVGNGFLTLNDGTVLK